MNKKDRIFLFYLISLIWMTYIILGSYLFEFLSPQQGFIVGVLVSFFSNIFIYALYLRRLL